MASSTTLIDLLEQAQRRGWIGRAPISDHCAHAEEFVDLLPREVTRLADLGPGGGLPALVILEARPDISATLIERSRGRSDALTRALRVLGWEDRAEVVCREATEVARDPQYRGLFGAVVARSFAPPAITAECSAPLLAVGGVVLVSDPPFGGQDRWDADGLSELGLVREQDASKKIRSTHEGHLGSELSAASITILRSTRRCPDRYPRRSAVMRREPLFHVKHPEGNGADFGPHP